MQALILAGGKGTRLAERLNGRPKPLVDVDGVPLLERQVTSLREYGFDDVAILVNHASDQIEQYCEHRHRFGLSRLRLLNDGPSPQGTAGSVLSRLDEFDDRFLVVYGDTLFNIDLARFLEAHDRDPVDATLFLHPNDHPIDSDLVTVDDDGLISGFYPKPRPPGNFYPNLVNAALYAIERDALIPWRHRVLPLDFGADLFPAMLAAGARLRGYNSFEYIKDIGTPKRLDKAIGHLRSGVVARATLALPQACVFLDRDGTLNALRDYVRKPEDLSLLPGAAHAVRRFNDSEFRVAVVTNQPVIARGECTFDGLRAIHAKLDTELAEDGAFLDRIYSCPHHPDSGFAGEVVGLKIRCDCRKPQVGMIRSAAKDLNVDLDRSWLIGDSTSDLEAARRAGLRSILVRTGEAGRDRKYAVTPDFITDDLAAAAEFILDVYPRLMELASEVLTKVNLGTVIAISGLYGAGKSTLAHALRHELARRRVPVTLLSSSANSDDMVEWSGSTTADPDVSGRAGMNAGRVWPRTDISSMLSNSENHVTILDGIDESSLDIAHIRDMLHVHLYTMRDVKHVDGRVLDQRKNPAERGTSGGSRIEGAGMKLSLDGIFSAHESL